MTKIDANEAVTFVFIVVSTRTVNVDATVKVVSNIAVTVSAVSVTLLTALVEASERFRSVTVVRQLIKVTIKCN